MKSLFEKLGLTDDNAGVFYGEWRGGGAKIDKISEPIPEPWMPHNPRESDSPARTRGIPFLAA